MSETRTKWALICCMLTVVALLSSEMYKPLIKSPVILADGLVSIVQVCTACESQTSVSTTVLFEKVVLPTLEYIAHHVQSSA